MVLWDGACMVHEAFSIDKLIKLHLENPLAAIIAHPESEEHILKVATYVGSTTGLINFVKNDSRQSFIVATEAGILHQMNKEVPHKKIIPAPVHEDNTCACGECGYMRMNTLEKLYRCLRDETPEIIVPEHIAAKALTPVLRMLEISKT
jgi:quinolinate synthase